MTYPTLKTDDGWELFPLFAKAVSIHHVDETICKELQDLEVKCNWNEDDGTDGCKGAVSTEKNVLDMNPVLKQKLHSIVYDYVQTIMGYICDVQFTTSWFARTYEDGFCEEHMHSNAWFSGIIYYGEYEKDTAPIQFTDSNPHSVCVKVSEFNFFNAFAWNIQPEHALIVMFPSELRHKVLKNKSQWTRNALAFNVMPKGDVGIQDSVFQY